MALDQEVSKVPGKNVWVETVSFLDESWFAFWSLTRVGTEVRLFKQEPPKRSEKSSAHKFFCAIPLLNIVCLIIAAVSSAKEKKLLWEPEGNVRIDLHCEYQSRNRVVQFTEDQVCKRSNFCQCKKQKGAVGIVNYPQFPPGDPITGVKSRSITSIDGSEVRHGTEAGSYAF